MIVTSRDYTGSGGVKWGMAKLKRPRDPNQLAKLIVDLSTGEARERDTDAAKNPIAVAAGRLGGARGGRARAQALAPQRRTEIARKAAVSRWGKKR